ELDGGKAYMRGLFPIQTATQAGLSNQLKTGYVFGLPEGYSETLPAKGAAGTSEQGESAAAARLRAGKSVIAIPGGYGKAKDQLGDYKNITFIDADGNPTAPPTDR